MIEIHKLYESLAPFVRFMAQNTTCVKSQIEIVVENADHNYFFAEKFDPLAENLRCFPPLSSISLFCEPGVIVRFRDKKTVSILESDESKNEPMQ